MLPKIHKTPFDMKGLVVCFFAIFLCNCEKKPGHTSEEVEVNAHNAMMMIYGLNKYNYGYYQTGSSNELDSAHMLNCYPFLIRELSPSSKDSSIFTFSWRKDGMRIQNKRSFYHYDMIVMKNKKVVKAGITSVIIPIENYSFYQDSAFIEILNSGRMNLHPWLHDRAKKIGLIKLK